MGFTPWGPAAPLGQVAATPYPGGFALQNATPAILSWTAPNDGRTHRVEVFFTSHTTVAATGGKCVITGTAPDGSGALSTQILAPGQAVGTTINLLGQVVAPGSTVMLSQSGVLTAGTITVWAEMWAS